MRNWKSMLTFLHRGREKSRRRWKRLSIGRSERGIEAKKGWRKNVAEIEGVLNSPRICSTCHLKKFNYGFLGSLLTLSFLQKLSERRKEIPHSLALPHQHHRGKTQPEQILRAKTRFRCKSHITV